MDLTTGFPDTGKILLFCPERFPHGGFALGRGFHLLPPAGCWFLGRAATRGFLDGWGCWFGFLSRGFNLRRGLCFPPAGRGGFSWLRLHRRGSAPGFRRRPLLHPVRKRDSTRSERRRKTLPGAELLSSVCINKADLGILALCHGCSFPQQYVSLAKSQRARTLADLATLSTPQSPPCSASQVSSSFVRQINIQIMTMTQSRLSEQFRDLSALFAL